ncbi:MAG: helix-turn-helix domain-containing protein [Merdibacter sp.]|nr:helix-turn-helix domain-containing protein [Candidatus Merdibacter merdipullorum]
MNQKQIGRYIAEKRRIKNLTQAQLAEQLGISDKTVSKWECGRSMPDYALIQSLCETLDISVSELIEGKNTALHERQLMELLRRTQELERQNGILHGVIMLIFGIALQALAPHFVGSPMQDLLSGIILGLSVGILLLGIYLIFQAMQKP